MFQRAFIEIISPKYFNRQTWTVYLIWKPFQLKKLSDVCCHLFVEPVGVENWAVIYSLVIMKLCQMLWSTNCVSLVFFPSQLTFTGADYCFHNSEYFFYENALIFQTFSSSFLLKLLVNTSAPPCSCNSISKKNFHLLVYIAFGEKTLFSTCFTRRDNREFKNHDDDFVDDDRKWDTVHCARAISKFRRRGVVDDAKHSGITSSCNPQASAGITPCF